MNVFPGKHGSVSWYNLFLSAAVGVDMCMCAVVVNVCMSGP